MSGDPIVVREAEIRYTRKRRTLPAGFRSSVDVAKFARTVIPDAPQERMIAIALDNKGRPIAWHVVGVGALSSCPADPGVVLRFGLLACASAIILVHNHPSGDPTPSTEDLAFTKRIQAGAELMGLTLTDHVVVCPDRHASFLDAGLLGSE